MSSPSQPLITILSPTDARDAVALLLADRGRETSLAISATVDEQTDAEGRIAGMVAALRGATTVGAVLLRRQPGRVAQLWTPRLVAGEPADTAVRLVREALEIAADWRCSLVQAAPESALADPLQPLYTAGFEHFADLLYMVSLPDAAPREQPSPSFDLVAYRDGDDDRLATVIEQTYIGTLDCPRLNGVRQTADVIEGHRATGVFDPNHWFFARQAGEDIGCLLLANHASANTWELVYFGLVPAARGHGYGRQMVHCAQWLACRAGARQLVLAVSADNPPATDAYLSAGFVVWDRRPIYLKILTPCSMPA